MQLLAKSQAALLKGNISSARLSLNRVLRQYPDDIRTQLTVAKLQFADGDLISGTRSLTQLADQCITNDDKNYSAHVVAELRNTELLFPLKKTLQAIHQKSELTDTLLLELATINLQTGDVEKAIEYLSAFTGDTPLDAAASLQRGHAFKALSDIENAANAYHKYINLAPQMSGSGYWSLADLKAYYFTQADISAMKNCSLDNTYQQGLLILAQHHAAAQQNEPELAIRLLSQAKKRLNQSRKLNLAGLNRLITDILTAPKYLEEKEIPSKQPPYPVPIFIVGLPRSGTTLTEQILAAHSQVTNTDELPFIERIALYLSRKGLYPAGFQTLEQSELQRLRQFYLSQAEQYDVSKQDYFIDKNPNNILHIGLIKCLFPDAKILCLSRPVSDNAVSLYRQHFSKGNDYAYSPNDITHYISKFYTLVRHWLDYNKDTGNLKETENHTLYIIDYEQLVKEPEQGIRRILSLCGLEFQSACLTFHSVTSPVLTPSASQVRQPINSASLGTGNMYLPIFNNTDVTLETLEAQRQLVLQNSG